MRSHIPFLATAISLMAAPLSADTPRVVTDILPVQAIAARVMDGVAVPEVLVGPGASPHGAALRPSQARSLAEADLVVWVGPELTPWLDRSLENLSENARTLQLLELPETELLVTREAIEFESADHEDEHGDEHGDEHDDHGSHDEHDHEAHADHEEDDHHEEHDEHGHEEHADEEHAHEEHGHDEHGHDEHGHHHEVGGTDPHAWLDPDNAAVWSVAIAEALAEIDPDNAESYRSNAEAAQAELAALSADIDAELAPVRGKPYIVLHDAYQYFEHRFDMSAAAAIALSDASAPGPARLQAVRDIVLESGAACVFSEPQLPGRFISTVISGTDVRSEDLDPLGWEEGGGIGAYPALLHRLAGSIASCLGGEASAQTGTD